MQYSSLGMGRAVEVGSILKNVEGEKGTGRKGVGACTTLPVYIPSEEEKNDPVLYD